MAKKPTVDGFIPRRSQVKLGELHHEDRKLPQAQMANFRRHQAVAPTEVSEASTTNALAPSEHGLSRQQGISRADVDESLREIDDASTQRASKQRKRGGFWANRKRIVKALVLFLLLITLVVGGWIGVKAFLASRSLFKGDIFGLVQHKKLQQDEGGRTNILILGTSEDDPGHEGAHLTDSIMVLSVDQTNKNAYMVSIPRDMQVKYGMACNSGYAGKINEYFNCVNEDWNSESAETERQTKSREFFGDILGIDIQYSAHVNYSVMRDVVDALGGITVTIESTDPRGQMDANFDWKCGDTYAKRMKNCPPRGHFIDYPNGPVNLDAEHALYLAQARGDVENWGFSRSNPDREQNQQKILKAIKEKAMSSGTLTNPMKVSKLIDAVGNNLRTNFETSEVSTLVSLAQTIPSDSIAGTDLMVDGVMNGDGQPAAGLYTFTKLQAYIKKKFYATGIAKEDAHVVVLNASGVAGAAQTEADKLTALGMTALADNAPARDFSVNIVYQVKQDAKPMTAAKLASLYGASPKLVTAVPGVTLAEDTDYVVILVKENTGATGNTNAE